MSGRFARVAVLVGLLAADGIGQIRIREEIELRPTPARAAVTPTAFRVTLPSLPLLRAHEFYGVTWVGVTRRCSIDASGSLTLGPTNKDLMALGSSITLFLQVGGTDHLIYRIRNNGGTIETASGSVSIPVQACTSIRFRMEIFTGVVTSASTEIQSENAACELSGSLTGIGARSIPFIAEGTIVAHAEEASEPDHLELLVLGDANCSAEFQVTPRVLDGAGRPISDCFRPDLAPVVISVESRQPVYLWDITGNVGASLSMFLGDDAYLVWEGGPPGTVDSAVVTAAMGEVTTRTVVPLICPPPPGAHIDHFEVRTEPDTVAFTETARIFVRAMDAAGHPVQLDGEALLTFALGGEYAYGTFIGPTGDTLTTLPVELKNIPNRDALAGNVRFAAVAANPASVGKPTIFVRLQSDPTKTGSKKMTVLEQHLSVVMEGARTVRPLIPTENGGRPGLLNRKTFAVRLTRGGVLKGDHPFTLSTSFVAGVGGHDHTNARTDTHENLGYFMSGQQANVSGRPLRERTRSEVMSSYDYVASVWGDRMLIRVQSDTNWLLWDTVSVVEMVEGLVLFDGSGSYRLTGSLPAHPDNHYMSSQAAVNSLISAANGFAEARWNTTGSMRLNDMSLVWGGLFDVDSNWTTPHSLHRVGKSVDIENLFLVQIDTIDQKNGKAMKLTVPKATWVDDFMDFMANEVGRWSFEDEGQQRTDVFDRTRKYPHFEWEGE